MAKKPTSKKPAEAPPQKTGRKSKFTLETREKLISLLKIGITDKDACPQAGISVSTFYDWVDIGDAVREDRLHDRMPKDEETRQLYLEFSDSVSRARSESNGVAVVAFRTGLRPSEILEETVDTFTETRLDRNGVPYEYTRTTKKVTTRKLPADWRAGADWLRRRDPDNWSDKIDTRQTPSGTTWEEAMRGVSTDPSNPFE